MGPARLRLQRLPGAVLALGAVAGAAAACGPSFQAVYECDVRFEHCYALDQGAVPSDSKKDCWRDWLHGYTYGQSRDRVEYAAQRFGELSIGNTLPSVETRDARPSARTAVAPVPTNAFAPPPNVAEHTPSPADPTPSTSATAAGGATPATSGTETASGSGAATRPVHAAVVVAHAPGQDCAGECLERWNSCKDGCKNGACGAACDRAYRSCVPACFK